MQKKTTWSLAFNLMNHLMAWVIPVIIIVNKYGFIVDSTFGKIVFGAAIGLIIALRFIMYRLKVTAESGYGLEKELAREFRFLIPTIILLLLVNGLNKNVADLVDILTFTLALNVVAVPFRIAAYRLSKRYENDVAPRQTLEYLKRNN